MAHSHPPDFLAEVKFFTTKEDGRLHPPVTGYRGQLRYDGKYNWSMSHDFVGTDLAPLGQVVKVYLTLGDPDVHIGNLYNQMEFDICEGGHTVGKGKIIELLNSQLMKTDWSNTP